MVNLKQYNLGLFLTEKNSLRTWDEAGLLHREIAPYNRLAKEFGHIYIFTYEGRSELTYQDQLAENVSIVYKNVRMPARWYRWLLPFIHWNTIRVCHVLKTNQFKSRAALIAKYIFPRKRFVLRTGYTPSLFAEKRNKHVPRSLARWERRAYRICDQAFVAGTQDKDYLVSQYDLDPEKFTLIPNYIDTDLFAPNTSTRKKENTIVYVGKIDPQKNLPHLIEALAGTDIKLDIIGGRLYKEESKKLHNKLCALADKYDVTVTWRGIVPNQDLPQILNTYPVFVLPSLYEGTPKVLLEAMSCGMACVGTDVEGTRDIISHDVDGLLANTSPESLREHIVRLMEDQALQQRLGTHAREFIINHYALDTQIQKELAIYKTLLQN